MALSAHSWHSIRLSAHGSWPRGAGPAPGARRSASTESNISYPKIILTNFEILEFTIFRFLNYCIFVFGILNFEQLKSRRRAPENNEDPRKEFKILDMHFISIKKHEMQIW